MKSSVANTSDIFFEAPCDLYGRDARMLHHVLTGVGGVHKIVKPRENRSCEATSLLGLLSLHIKKGEQVCLIADCEKQQDLARILSNLQKQQMES